MTSSTTNILFLALLLVYSSRAVSGNWIPLLSPIPGTALVTVVQSSQSAIKLELSVPGFFLEKKNIQDKPYVIPVLENAHPMLRKGDPDLPKITATLEIPSSGDFQPTIVSSKYNDYQGYSIAPSAGNIIRNTSQPIVEFSNVYQEDEFFPGKLLESSSPYIIRNSRNQVLQLYPFQYNPVTGVLRVYYEIQIELSRTSAGGINTLSGSDQGTLSMLDIVHQTLNTVEAQSLKSGILPAEIGRMLIICPEEFKDAMEPFTTWKNQCGIATEITDAAQFTSPDQIKQFVQNYYTETGNLSYLLLVGDAEQVPPYMYNNGASDNYYSYLAGDDHYPDILVGRFSAGSIKDVEVQVNRTVQYEQNPGINPIWLSKATGIASTMGPGDDGETDYNHVRNLLASLKKFTYTTISEFYDGNQGGADADGNPSTESEMDDFNTGTGLILYTGHGSTSTWATGRITRSVVNSINNQGKYPFIWSTACETGNFAGSNCLAEAWMRASNENNEPMGSVAALMASGSQTSNPPMEGQDEMVSQLVKAGQENTSRTFGGLSISGMYKMNDIYGEAGNSLTDTWILFGDPSLQVRTAVPEVIKVRHNEWIGRGRTEYDLTTNTNSGTACLSSNGTILGSAIINNGHAVILLKTPVQGDKVLLTITSFNYLPYQAEIRVTDIPTVPGDCFPTNHSKRIPILAQFSWNSGSGGLPDHYVFYLGTDNPPTNVCNGITLNNLSFLPDLHLNYQTTYYWRIDAVNASGFAKGKVQDFETIYGPDEDFENMTFSPSKWTSAGNVGWSIDQSENFQGSKSCRSGDILKGNYSSLLYPCEVKNCDFVGFWFKTVLQPGSKLQFIVDASVLGEWSGQRNWTYMSYDIEPGNHSIEWRFTSNSNSPSPFEAAWLDDISLPLHARLLAESGEGKSICEGENFIPKASAENYNSVLWTSNGDGSFDDNNLLQPEYIPGPEDLKNGEVQITIKVNGFEGCPEQFSSTTIYPSVLPEINLPSDTIAPYNSPLILDASTIDAESWKWLPGNETTPSIIVDSIGLDRGTKTVILQVTSHSGCTIQKEIKVHFPATSEKPAFIVYPSPCKEYFNIEPENGALLLDHVKLYNSMGELVWQQYGSIEIIGHQEFTLPALPASIYFLHVGNTAGESIKSLVIK
jgi:hypothetical protein